MDTPLHHNVRDIRGLTFGRLLVLEYVGQKRWQCRCSCGTDKIVSTGNLNSGSTISCGCWSRELSARIHRKHGMADGPEYRTWVNMKYRCLNPHAPNYARYGGVGITVCDRWRDSFEAFFQDMGPKPSRQHSIDRIDGTRGYEPGNCRWATGTTQHRNKRSNHRLSFNGKHLTIEEWSSVSGIGRETIAQRLRRGWTVEDALSKPVR